MRAQNSSAATDIVCVLLLALSVAGTWLPRLDGPIDLRWDAGAFYVLGKSLASGQGYRLLNEPGEIRAIQDPPLLPAIVAAHIVSMDTDSIETTGFPIRITILLFHLSLVLLTYVLARGFLSPSFAFLAAFMTVVSDTMIYASDLCQPEIPYAVVSIAFFLLIRAGSTTFKSIAMFTLALIGFALRSAGVILFISWITDSFFRKNYRQMMIRTVVSVVPVMLWTGYIQFVKSGSEYRRPAYSYQRSDFLYHNVSYLEYIRVKDPHQPEKGRYSSMELAGRIYKIAPQIPKKIGGTVCVNYGYLKQFFHRQKLSFSLPEKLNVMIATFFGAISLAGAVILVKKGERLILIYLVFSLIPVCLWQYTDEMYRILTPLVPFFAITFAMTLSETASWVKQKASRSTAVAVIVLPLILWAGLSYFSVRDLFRYEHREVSYPVQGGNLKFRLFSYDTFSRSLESAGAWLKGNAIQSDVIATAMPHYLYLRTGLKCVLPPFVEDPSKVLELMDSVPVKYVVLDEPNREEPLPHAGRTGMDRIAAMIQIYPEQWTKVYSTGTATVWQHNHIDGQREAVRKSP